MPHFVPTLPSCIVESLKRGIMLKELPDALLIGGRTKLAHRDETEYWDYKEEIDLDDPAAIARLAKRVLGFYNWRGGVLIFGVANNYRIPGLPANQVRDTNYVRSKLHRYIGSDVHVFQDSIPLSKERALWLLFVPPHQDEPQAALDTGPVRNGKSDIRKGEYYLRRGDEVITCTDSRDHRDLWRGNIPTYVDSYLYEIDEPYFRLLAPDFVEFFGRTDKIAEIAAALQTRHPVIALDGAGGVGKTATAIKVVRHLYDAGEQLFIVSLSAKSRVWEGSIDSRRPAFSGQTEFLRETAKILQISPLLPPDELKKTIIDTISGCKGIFLVDNIEEIKDDALLRFLSIEIPDPVKVIVTSRVDRKIGALTISIPEMTADEARLLLTAELSRAHFPTLLAEHAALEEIIAAAGGVPLALKWAVGLALSTGSLREASHRLRHNDNLTKKEFLNFCFHTMFDALSTNARETALLSAYLDHSWSIETLCLALNRTREDVEAALTELRERGVIMASTKGDDFRVLPLTMDFLLSKWHENDNLQRRVATHLANTVDSAEYEGILLHWPLDQRVSAVRRRAEHLIAQHQLDTASKLLDVAVRWSPNPNLRFLLGRVKYEQGKRAEGIDLMREAIQPTSTPEEHEYLATALTADGRSTALPLAVAHLETALLHREHPTAEAIAQFCELAVRLKKFDALARVLERLQEPEQRYVIANSLPPVLDDPKLLAWCGPSLVTIFNAAAKHTITAEERDNFERAARRLKTALALFGEPARAGS